ncbi:hypothetical protein LCGC14_1563890 [marine sediment metagenome]|uniref:Uncharacterized protein n=1 Tax=marine sediment metagenome TaxID=412755 RepID=A0A0F9LMC1_9ZZZZ
MNGEIDVTAEVDFGWNDDETLPLTKCVCGEKWGAWSGPLLGIEKDYPTECPNCGRKLYWTTRIRVLEITDQE